MPSKFAAEPGPRAGQIGGAAVGGHQRAHQRNGRLALGLRRSIRARNPGLQRRYADRGYPKHQEEEGNHGRRGGRQDGGRRVSHTFTLAETRHNAKRVPRLNTPW